MYIYTYTCIYTYCSFIYPICIYNYMSSLGLEKQKQVWYKLIRPGWMIFVGDWLTQICLDGMAFQRMRFHSLWEVTKTSQTSVVHWFGSQKLIHAAREMIDLNGGRSFPFLMFQQELYRVDWFYNLRVCCLSLRVSVQQEMLQLRSQWAPFPWVGANKGLWQVWM